MNVVLGNGDGSFGTQQTISTLTYNSDSTDPKDPDPPTAVVAADLDGDGFVDIAFTEPGHNSIGVLYGNGNGTFDTRVDYPAGESPAALVTGNLNGDQTSLGNDRLDLVAVDTTKSQVSILLGQKYTTTMALEPQPCPPSPGEGQSVLTPVVNSAYVSQPMPLTGLYQLYVDTAKIGASQPLSSTFELTKLAAGQHMLWAKFLGDDDYDVSTTSTSTITVLPAKLTVTALGYSRAYGAADPTATAWPYIITGFVNGDFQGSNLTGSPTLTTTDTSWNPSTGTVPSPVGNYTIAVSPGSLSWNYPSLAHPNYVFDSDPAHYVPGTLTITPAPLTITASNAER